MNKRSKSSKATKRANTEPRASRPRAPGYGIEASNKGNGLLPWTWAQRELEKSRNYWIATLHPAGRPHVMPVWGVWRDNAFYFSTGRNSRKFRNLARNPACAVCSDNSDEAVVVEGTAEVISEKSALKPVFAAYKEKYKMDIAGMGEPLLLVRPKVVFGLIEKTFPKSATKWEF
jgi:PPOX class probable F420-dependent enzyme